MSIAVYRRLYPGDSLREIRAMPWHLFTTMIDAGSGQSRFDEPEQETGSISDIVAWREKYGEKKIPAWRRAFDAAHSEGGK